MCGIFARFSKRALSDEDVRAFASMSETLLHRGPDASHWLSLKSNAAPVSDKEATLKELCKESSNGEVAWAGILGHHRLSVIDLSRGGDQPFVSSCGRYVLTYNGEIYNYLELRKELSIAGWMFESSSDTEVLLASYAVWGRSFLERLNGDFAFLLIDRDKELLFGARDRFGVKPLFYFSCRENLVFASELKTILASSIDSFSINEELLYRYLAADFPPPSKLNDSFVQNIHSVPPGTAFETSLRDLQLQFLPFWSLGSCIESPGVSMTIEDVVLEFDALFTSACELRTRADVPLAVFLSGGLDSSAIVSTLCSENMKPNVLSAVFPGYAQVDESEAIRKIQKHLLLENAHCVRHSNKELTEDLCTLIRTQDQPFATLNVFSQYLLFQSAREFGYKVVLDGSGADELLAGYSDYQLFSELDEGMHSEILDEWRSGRFQQRINHSERDWRTVRYLMDDFAAPFRERQDGIDRPIPSNFLDTYRGSFLKHALRESVTRSWMNKSVGWDCRYLDLNGMHCGVEARVPFLDHRLVEFIFSLSPRHLYHQGESKRILRACLRGRIPERIRQTKEKVGFTFPFCSLMQRDRGFRDFFFELSNGLSSLTKCFVDERIFRDELRDITNGTSQQYNVWRVFNLDLWIKEFFEGS